MLSEARVLIKRTIEKHTERMNPLDLNFWKDELTDTVSTFLMQKTQKSPMVIPVLIGLSFDRPIPLHLLCCLRPSNLQCISNTPQVFSPLRLVSKAVFDGHYI